MSRSGTNHSGDDEPCRPLRWLARTAKWWLPPLIFLLILLLYFMTMPDKRLIIPPQYRIF